MKIVGKNIILGEDDLKELYSLFCSPTRQEREQVYDPGSTHYFANVDLSELYELSQEKREYAADAWRAVTAFLEKRGVSLQKDGDELHPDQK